MFKERLKTLRAMFEEYGKLQNNPNILFWVYTYFGP
jgi:hypothetical protein